MENENLATTMKEIFRDILHVLACFPFIPHEEKGIDVSPQKFKWLETWDPRKLQENL